MESSLRILRVLKVRQRVDHTSRFLWIPRLSLYTDTGRSLALWLLSSSSSSLRLAVGQNFAGLDMSQSQFLKDVDAFEKP